MIKIFKNIYFDSYRDTIYLWEQIKGEDFYDEIPWCPYVYVPVNKSDIKTIHGKPVSRKTFRSSKEYKEYLKEKKHPDIYENEVKPEIQFLAERYHGIPDEEMEVPKLKIYILDIEVHSDKGFPNPLIAKDPITLATIRNSLTGESFTFGYDLYHQRRYSGNKKIHYIKCDTEDQLLKYLFNYMNKYPCDILTGYNIWSFDLPYLVNRANVLWGEKEGKKMYNRMSPINKVSVWKQRTSDDLNIDIAGCTILDYYEVYKWYGKKLERYTLEYVSQHELGSGKVINPYSDLNEFARQDWNTFVDYNVRDCERVDSLEKKLGYIRLIQAISLFAKVPAKFYNAQTQLIEGAMLCYYRRNNLCAPHFYGGTQENFDAGHVKEPNRNMHDWVVDIDITSSYPSHIITLNMSIETFIGKIIKINEENIIHMASKKEFEPFSMLKMDYGDWKTVEVKDDKLESFNMALKKGLISISPIGSIFNTKKLGVTADLEKQWFAKRKEVKTRSKQLAIEATKAEGKEKIEKENRSKELDSLQSAIKVFLNAFFGIMSVPYSRYHCLPIAEAITSCARNTIKKGEIFCNDLLNNPTEELLSLFPNGKRKNFEGFKDYVYYIDTDSLFVGIGEWIKDQGYESEFNKLSDEEKIKFIKKISKIMEGYIDKRIYEEVQLKEYNSQVHDFKIGFKQEIIAKTALFVKKKKYCYWLVDKEGIPKDEISVTGLELVRSDSSEAVRPRLKHIMELIMKKRPEKEIYEYTQKYVQELRKLEPADLAANIGINGLKKYSHKGEAKKGTPWHVKGAYNYRKLLKALGIENKYEDIYEGLKAKVVYVMKNPFNVDTISFHEWPKEFDNVLQYDPDMMIEKFFINKIRFLLEPMGKEHIIERDDSKLEAFF